MNLTPATTIVKNNSTKPNIFVNQQKSRKGLNRLIHATRYSWRGILDAWHEKAFRLECKIFVISTPLALLIGNGWLEKFLLIASIWVLMLIEVLNSAIESAIDRVGSEEHELSRRAKDLGSAAVLMGILLCLALWTATIYNNIRLFN
nr:diacylglycerol kinase [Delftia tsuruhatensis]